MTGILLKDIAGKFKSGGVYGKKGERVTIIADHGEALVVESAKGERFSVNVKSIQITIK